MLLIYFSTAKKCRHCGNFLHSENKIPLCKSFVQSLEGEATWYCVDFFEQDIHTGDLSTTDVFSYSNLVRQKNTTDI